MQNWKLLNPEEVDERVLAVLVKERIEHEWIDNRRGGVFKILDKDQHVGTVVVGSAGDGWRFDESWVTDENGRPLPDLDYSELKRASKAIMAEIEKAVEFAARVEQKKLDTAVATPTAPVYNINVQGNLVGSAIGGGTVNAENIAGGDITVQETAVPQQTNLQNANLRAETRLLNDPDLIEVYESLINNFNLSEIQELCLYLHLDYEILNGANKADKARELVLYCQRHGRLQELKAEIIRQRPDVS